MNGFDSVPTVTLRRRVVAEGFGTFWLVFGGCGSVIFSHELPNGGLGPVGVSFAFGLTLLTMACAISTISGCHINPAVTLALCIAEKFSWSDFLPYLGAQLLGACTAGVAIYLIAGGPSELTIATGFAANGFGAHSPTGFSAASCFVAEIILTAGFVFVVLASTDRIASPTLAPIAVGLALTLVHLVGIPITNTSVNPARSTATAIFAGAWAIRQLWMFWVAPCIGASFAALMYARWTRPALQRNDPKLSRLGWRFE